MFVWGGKGQCAVPTQFLAWLKIVLPSHALLLRIARARPMTAHSRTHHIHRCWRGMSALWPACCRHSAACTSRGSTLVRTGASGNHVVPTSLQQEVQPHAAVHALPGPAFDRLREFLRKSPVHRRLVLLYDSDHWTPGLGHLWMMVAYRRPLSEELLQYAQTDVHCLCYLAGQLCARLAAKGPDCLREASRRSHEMSLALYTKPTSEVHYIRDLIIFTSCALIGCNACSDPCMSCVQCCAIGLLAGCSKGQQCPELQRYRMETHLRRLQMRQEDMFPSCAIYAQAAVNAAVTSALRRAKAPAAQACGPKDASLSCMADCMHVLCQWRDERARLLDEGGPAPRMYPLLCVHQMFLLLSTCIGMT